MFRQLNFCLQNFRQQNLRQLNFCQQNLSPAGRIWMHRAGMQARLAAVERQRHEFDSVSSSVDTRADTVRAPHMDFSSVLRFEGARDGSATQQPVIRRYHQDNSLWWPNPMQIFYRW